MSRRGLLLVPGCALILCCVAPAGVAVADNCLDPGLVNGSAEDTLAAMSGVGGAAPAGWTVTGGLTSRHYAAPGSLHDPPGNSWGVRYFEGGDSPLATATQTLPVRPGCEDTYDVPFFWFLISAHLGAVEGEPDAARVELRFLDSGGQPLGGFQIGQAPDGTPAPDGVGTWLWEAYAMRPIPPGTRSTEIRVVLDNFNGGRNTAWVDRVEAHVTWEDPVQPTTWGGLKALYR